MTTKAHFTDTPPAEVREIVLGQGEDTHYYVLIEDDNIPILTLRIDFPVEWGAFREVEVFGGYVAIGIQDRFYLFDMISESCMTLKLDGYFGHLYVDGDELFVCSMADILCIDSSGATRWRSDKIAVDGDILRVSAELDPPGGWINKLINRHDGMVL